MSTTALRLCGVPLSQPFRAVAWALLQKKTKFAVEIAVPGMGGKVGTKGEAFQARSPLGHIPLLVDSGLTLSESGAILTYLAETGGWSDLYPDAPAARAKVNSYMHWHHNATRSLAFLNTPIIRPDMGEVTDEEMAARKVRAGSTLGALADGWLGGEGRSKSSVGGLGRGGFLGGSEAPTVADLLAYEEVVQVSERYLNLVDTSAHPRVADWLDRMGELPYHAEAHAALQSLGDLAAPNETPIPKRLAAATKAGMQALKAVQEEW